MVELCQLIHGLKAKEFVDPNLFESKPESLGDDDLFILCLGNWVPADLFVSNDIQDALDGSLSNDVDVAGTELLLLVDHITLLKPKYLGFLDKTT